MKFYRLPILLISVSIGLWSSLSLASSTITVQGMGQASQAPDKLRFQATVLTEAALGEVAKGIEANNQKMEEIFQALQKLGIQETDMQTLNFSVLPQYEYSSNSKQNLYAYQIKNNLSICVRNMSTIGTILATTGESALISNFQFEVDDLAPLLSTARSKAMKNARQKAEEYAKAGGFQISKEPLTVEETTHYNIPETAAYNRSAGTALKTGKSVSDVTTALGQITYSAYITVVYEILPLLPAPPQDDDAMIHNHH